MVQRLLRDAENVTGNQMAENGTLPDNTYHDERPDGLSDPQQAITAMPNLLNTAQEGPGGNENR